MSFGKFIGGGLGWVLGGPIGALVGFAIGSYFDSAAADDDQEELPRRTTGKHNQTQPGDFAMSLLVLISAVMNADGRVMRSELDMVKVLLMRTYTDEQVKQYLLILRELLKKQVDVAGVCKQIRANMSYSQRLELLHILFRISRADGDVSEGEIRMLEYIAAHMGITTPDYLSVRAMFVTSTEADYEILEIKPDTTDDEVKRAYRRMAMKYHPDKLSGLGEQMKKEAEDKFRRVQQAYEQIKKKRGMA